MSPSPRSSDAADDVATYEGGWHQVAQLVVEGYSWSGNERHCCFLNTGGPHFANASFASGFDLKDDGRGLALVDWDRDGDLDCWINNRTGPQVRLLRNESDTEAHYLTLKLQGTECNRDALGARVIVETDGDEAKRHVRTVRAGSGFLSQSARTLHFGLGQAETITRLTVIWPGGDTEDIAAPEIDQSCVIVQNSHRAIPEDASAAPSRLLAADPETVRPLDTGRRIIIGATRVPRSVTCQSADGSEIALSRPSGKSTLVLLWSPTCTACLQELKDLSAHADELNTGGMRIIAVTPSDADESSRDRARRILSTLNAGAELAWASEAQLTLFDRLQKMNSMRQRPLVLPTGFLIDGAGHLTAVYRGPVSVERLLTDVRRMSEGPGMIMYEALPFAGRLHPDSLIARAGILLGAGHPGRALDDVNRAIEMQPLVADHFRARQAVHRALSEWDLAVQDGERAKWLSRLPEFDRAVSGNPGSPQVWLERARYRLQGNELSGAVADFDHVLQIDGNHVEALLGAAEVSRLLQRFEQAIRYCDRAIRQDAGFDGYSLRGDCWYELGEYQRALEDYEETGRFDGWVADCYLQRSYLRREAGDRQGADEDYRQAVRMDPTLASDAAE